MSAGKKQRNITVCSIIISSALLIACGSGAGDGNALTPQPDAGEALAALPEDTIEPIQSPQTPVQAGSPPPSASCRASASTIQDSTLFLINQARASARNCGTQSFAATTPLTWNSLLQSAAQIHSNDMAQNNFFSHTGSDGSSSSQRATNQGYEWRTVGENIAAGQPTTESVVQAWLDSPGHCANLMNPNFKDVAVTCVENNGSDFRQYWTNALGAEF